MVQSTPETPEFYNSLASFSSVQFSGVGFDEEDKLQLHTDVIEVVESSFKHGTKCFRTRGCGLIHYQLTVNICRAANKKIKDSLCHCKCNR